MSSVIFHNTRWATSSAPPSALACLPVSPYSSRLSLRWKPEGPVPGLPRSQTRAHRCWLRTRRQTSSSRNQKEEKRSQVVERFVTRRHCWTSRKAAVEACFKENIPSSTKNSSAVAMVHDQIGVLKVQYCFFSCHPAEYLTANSKDHHVVTNGDIGAAADLSELSELPDESPSICVSEVLRFPTSTVDEFHY